MNDGFIQVLTTTETKEQAEKMAGAILEKQLAGCIQIFPITSAFRWKGKVESAQEWLCFIKTTAPLYQAVENTIKQMHTYETPEVLALPVVNGSKEYLAWLSSEVKE